MKKALLIIGILLLLNLVLHSFAANFTAGFVFQGLISISLILYALCFDRLARNVHITIGIVCLIPLFFMIFLAIYGNCDNSKYDEDVVIVLGAGIHGKQVSVPLARRLDKAVEYHAKNPEAVIVVCGGQGFQENITEALAMERYLIAKGIPQEQIIKEEKSTNTYQNFSFAREILLEQFPEGFTSVLITNDFHVYRATKLAQYAGISAKHIGAYTEWHMLLMNYSREMVAVCKMWITPPKAVSAEQEGAK